jgi:hypothetical protein
METTVRIERFKSVPSYDAAFDSLTKFYKRRKISHDRDEATVVDLTGDEDGSVDEIAQGQEGAGMDEDGIAEKAAGVMCTSIHVGHEPEGQLMPSRRSCPSARGLPETDRSRLVSRCGPYEEYVMRVVWI